MRLRLTKLSLGCAQLGNLYRAIPDDLARATVDAAWEAGIRHFDTAPHYGLGLSERRLGGALAGRPREEYVPSTKVGRRLEPLPEVRGRDDQGFDVSRRTGGHGFQPRPCRALLRVKPRPSGIGPGDIAYLHDPDDHYRDVLDHAYPALEELRSQGVVSAIGAGMNQNAMLAELARQTDMDAFMLAGRYTLLEQPALDDLLPVCQQT